MDLTRNFRRFNVKTKLVYLIIKRTIKQYGKLRSPESAAGMAFFGLFSLFPLLLLLVSLGSYILHRPEAQRQVLDIIMQAFPFSVNIVEENIQKVLDARGSVQIFGLLGFAWSAMGAFTVLTRNINVAWPHAGRHNYFKMRFMAFIMVAGVASVLFILLIANAALRLLPDNLAGLAAFVVSLQIISRIIIWMLTFIALFWLYQWIPNTVVHWSEAAWGALVGSTGTVLATSIFAWYLNSGKGLSNYNLVYGSLGAIVALLFWIYLLSIIVLFGAHLSSAIAYYTRINQE